jgi:hypothetical protein
MPLITLISACDDFHPGSSGNVDRRNSFRAPERYCGRQIDIG